MFVTMIEDIEAQIKALQQKKHDIGAVAEMSESTLNDIREVLKILAPYPNESKQFVDAIVSIINVDVPQLVNYRSTGESSNGSNAIAPTQVQSDEPKFDFPNYLIGEIFQYGDSVNQYIACYFDNLKSKNGTNSLKAWEKEIKGVFPAVDISARKVDDPKISAKYLMSIASAGSDVYDWLSQRDLTIRPEEQLVNIESNVEEISNDENMDSEVADDSDRGDDTIKSVSEELESIIVPEPEQINDVLRLTRLESNHRVARHFNENNELELYIGFDREQGFSDSSNMVLWMHYLDDSHPTLSHEGQINWEGSGIEGICILKVWGSMEELMKLIKYDFETTPIKSNLSIGGIEAVGGEVKLPSESPIESNDAIELEETSPQQVVTFADDDYFEVF